jgi:hypothetical protein
MFQQNGEKKIILAKRKKNILQERQWEKANGCMQRIRNRSFSSVHGIQRPSEGHETVRQTGAVPR